MKRSLLLPLSLFTLCALAAAAAPTASTPTTSTTPAAKSPAPPASTLPTAPLPVGLDDSALDRKANPCVDFYRYACGGWMDKTEIPADRPSTSRGFVAILERNELLMKDILERAVAKKITGKNAQKLADHWSTCMNEPALDANLPLLLKDAAAYDKVVGGKALATAVAQLHQSGVNVLFDLSSMQDLKDATVVVGGVSEAGLGMPDRDYYLATDEKTVKVRDAYKAHVQTMFELAGVAKDAAAQKRDLVLALETKLAEATRTKVEKRDIEKMFHRLEREGIKKAAPSFDWDAYLKARGQPKLKQINVAHPVFLETLEKLVKETTPETWSAYFTWAMLRGALPALPKAMQDERFAYESKALTGATADRPRWKKCVALADDQLGEALGEVFVNETFGKDGKARTLAMVVAVEEAFDKNLDALSWMDATTRAEARAKVKKMSNKIGYPDRWRDYSKFATTPKSFLKNYQAGLTFVINRDLNKIGKPIDKNEWYMSPPTVNAYNDGQMNEIVFPAGILQPPFFNKDAPDAVNFGAMGMVVGHEITHGFDDEGRKLDKDGNLRDWWSADAGKKFEEKTHCIVKQYDDSIALEDIHVNGKLTLGENTADLGGLKVSLQALAEWQRAAAARAAAPTASTTSPYSAHQLFFLGYAQSWCSKYRPENARLRAATDPHAPPFLRVNNPLANLPEFAAAFGCKQGDPMVRATRCEVW